MHQDPNNISPVSSKAQQYKASGAKDRLILWLSRCAALAVRWPLRYRGTHTLTSSDCSVLFPSSRAGQGHWQQGRAGALAAGQGHWQLRYAGTPTSTISEFHLLSQSSSGEALGAQVCRYTNQTISEFHLLVPSSNGGLRCAGK